MSILLKNKKELLLTPARASHAITDDVQAARNVLSVMLRGYPNPISVRLWNGETICGEAKSKFCIVVNDPSVISDILLRRDLVLLTKHYLSGLFTVEGRLEDLFHLGEWISRQHFTLQEKWFVTKNALRISTLKSVFSTGAQPSLSALKTSSMSVLSRQRNVGNSFYRLWLDPDMVYSCAYFDMDNQSLAAAQLNKFDQVCRKLGLQSGQHILDVGCGWGAFACWAARHHNVTVDGITTNRQQYQYSLARVHGEGLANRVNIRLMDFRDLPAKARYDGVLDIGTFDQGVRSSSLNDYQRLRRMLKPGGRILSHSMNSFEGHQRSQIKEYIHQYIHPEGELPRLSVTCSNFENAGFEIHDIASMHRHYVMTLKHWLARLRAHHEHAVTVASETAYRLWELYLAGCSHFFSSGEIGANQILASSRKDTSKIFLLPTDVHDPNANEWLHDRH